MLLRHRGVRILACVFLQGLRWVAWGTTGPHGFCAITGLPAKYKDPKTGLPYANVAAFKELRAKHAAEHGEEPEEAAAKVDASAEEKEEAKGGEEVKEEGQKEQGEEKEGEEEEEVEPLFLQKDRRWGLGGLAVS